MFGVYKPGAAEIAKSADIEEPICSDGDGHSRLEIHQELENMVRLSIKGSKWSAKTRRPLFDPGSRIGFVILSWLEGDRSWANPIRSSGVPVLLHSLKRATPIAGVPSFPGVGSTCE
jgi:hypothetical protein